MVEGFSQEMWKATSPKRNEAFIQERESWYYLGNSFGSLGKKLDFNVQKL
jgi:hypothetical protein